MAPVSSEASRGSLGLASGPVLARVVIVPRTVALTAVALPVRVWAAPAAGHASRPATTIGTATALQRYDAVRLMGYLPVSIRPTGCNVGPAGQERNREDAETRLRASLNRVWGLRRARRRGRRERVQARRSRRSVRPPSTV